MKKTMFWAMALFAAFAAASVPALAEHEGHGDKKQCSMGESCAKCGEKECGGKDCDGGSGCPIEGKILKKAKFFLKNQKEIGLSDEQVAQIKAIKTDTKKSGIRAKAEMEIFEMDLESKLSEPKVDVEGLNAMLDQAMTGWGTGAKQSVATYAKLKAILSDAQMAKAKEIWMAKDKDGK